jgi:ABC-type multidrug transport system ATPase subunit
MIRFDHVTKEYVGLRARLGGDRVRALDDVSLEVSPGTALGVVGPNGAGKSTLIRLLLGYLHPTHGEVRIGEQAPRAYAERYGIGYVPERVEVPPRWTVRGALLTYAALGEVQDAHARVEEEIERFGLEPLAGRRVRALSKGNLQRLALAQALLGERAVLVLDEPTDGLDPEWRARVREILAEWRAADPARVLLFASHDLGEVERVADRVAVLQDGRLKEVIELRAPAAATTLPPYRLELLGGDAAAARAISLFGEDAATRLPAADGAGEADVVVLRVTAADLDALNHALGRLIAEGVVVRALVPEHATLEQRFRRTLTS